MELPENFILIDKPSGITSFDVIRRLRKQTNIKKWGHAGTLDPAASGLMILAHGSGTKKLTDFIKLDKEYEAEIILGRSTTTGDRDGEVVAEQMVEISQSEISTILPHLIGTLTLPVSAYSAIKVDGVKMYKKAYAAEKRGEQITDVPTRDMTVYEATLLDQRIAEGKTIVSVRFAVGSGTYIRSLAEELGRLLNCPASLLHLRRTKIGEFNIKKALTIEDVKIEKQGVRRRQVLATARSADGSCCVTRLRVLEVALTIYTIFLSHRQ